MSTLLVSVFWIAACGAEGQRAPDGGDAGDAADGIDGIDGGDGVDAVDSGDTPDTPDSEVQDTGERPDTASEEVPDSAAPPPAGEFPRDHVLEVGLTLAASDWLALCAQRRSLFALLGEGCMSGPAPDVFTWFRADLELDGRVVRDVGLRKKGFLGSLDSERPSLRVELDEFVDGQKLDGLERLTLNNGKQDPSRLRQCLAYDLFRAAGVAAPRCSFAHVTVNRVDLGLYVHVEPVKKPFLRRWFGELAGTRDAGDGALWEGQLSDFRAGWLDTFEAKHDAMGAAEQGLLAAVATAMDGDDEGLVERLDAVLDLEQFIAFWAVEALTAHWDGYAGNTNNFFVYAPPEGAVDRRLRFIPWGVDQTFVDPRPFGGTRAVFATGALARRLYVHPEGRRRFEARLRELLATVWDEEALLATIEAWGALIRPHREPGTREAGDVALNELADFIVTRRDDIEGALDNPTAGFPPPLRGALCLAEDGTLAATFATTWGTLEIENLFLTGSGTFVLESPNLPELPVTMVGVKAGYSAESQAGQLVIGAAISGGGFVAAIVDLPAYPEEGVLELGVWPQGTVFFGAPSGEVVLLGLLSGTVTLEAVSAEGGAELRGRLDARLWTGLGSGD